MFSSEGEKGKFLGSIIDFFQDAYQAIAVTSSAYRIHTSDSGNKVLAFGCLPDYTDRYHKGEFNLVSSENHGVLDFISTKVNPKFSINEAAVQLFEQHHDKLSELVKQLIETPLVVTGHGLGGYLAILFTLLHQEAIDVEEYEGLKTAKRPICITFGSPLLGDEALRGAISERPLWDSCLVNVVAKSDTLASFFSLNTLYKPFGTFLFCTESGVHTAFEDQDAILAILDVMVSSNAATSQMHDYTNDLVSIQQKVLYRGDCDFDEFNLSSLRTEIVLQFHEIDVRSSISNDLISEMEKKQKRMIRKRKNTYAPARKLNDMKKDLACIEWYMKTRTETGGYYDIYKNAESKDGIISRSEVIRYQENLNQYWKKIVEKYDRKPQKEGAKLRKSYLYAGITYRRMIEPLDIANYYKKGKRNYIENRPNYYKLLEKWLNDDKKHLEPRKRKTNATSLTEDSCFWARVEEALIFPETSKNGDPSNTATEIEFEEYLLSAINDFSLSPDVFVDGSSLRTWWSKYYTYKGDSYNSGLAQYMKAENYKSYK